MEPNDLRYQTETEFGVTPSDGDQQPIRLPTAFVVGRQVVGFGAPCPNCGVWLYAEVGTTGGRGRRTGMPCDWCGATFTIEVEPDRSP